MKIRKTSRSRNYDYPEITGGAKAARKLRAEANKLSKSKRVSLFQRGIHVSDSLPGGFKIGAPNTASARFDPHFVSRRDGARRS